MKYSIFFLDLLPRAFRAWFSAAGGAFSGGVVPVAEIFVLIHQHLYYVLDLHGQVVFAYTVTQL